MVVIMAKSVIFCVLCFLVLVKHAFSETYVCATPDYLTTDPRTVADFVSCRDWYICADTTIISTTSSINCHSFYSCGSPSETGNSLEVCTSIHCYGVASCSNQNIMVYSTACATSNINYASCQSQSSCGGTGS